MRKQLQTFATERDWDQYHSPRNLLLALSGEVGELCEIFQWKGEVKTGLPEFSEEERIRVGEEMSDVFNYLIRFADRCRIDLVEAWSRKQYYNSLKYQAKLCKGSSKKYTEYQNKD
ncbi:hypothetical protein PPERSA_05721 [Pseudocohnilembus persalinus]|uniref:dCTP pyrophosphatase 1 n=1 Tax=Pseudocohnilembus persalinus TaxID=266149 RepID=A0A0V0QIH0_PSEPJ|nr:hypothetical protein PPERSA_05721 [Pseudocohnilembus persalinus]|eukprot:KRX01882.1 hypothetical protein PPERSA_05721 [Pseudocohnilembus persalinus]